MARTRALGVATIGSPLGGAAGCTFSLLARFNVANQGYANAQVLGAAEGVDTGQLTVVEVDGTLAVVGNECAFTAQGTPAWTDLGVYGQAEVRTLGKALFGIFDLNSNVLATSMQWDDAATVASPTVAPSAYQFAAAGVLRVRGGDNSEDPQVADYAASTAYHLAIVLGGYDVNGVPWDNSLPATYLHGAAFFIKGGAFATWTLLWRSVYDASTPLYAVMANYNNAGTLDDFRVPTYDYSAVLQPTVKDLFDEVTGTSLDAHTPDVSPGGGGWTEHTGDFDIRNVAGKSQARVINASITPVFAVASLSSGLADSFSRLEAESVAAGALEGLVYRLSDGNNWWNAMINESLNVFQIEECNGGVVTTRATVGVAIATNTLYEITKATDGNEHQAWLDGTNRLTWTSAFNAAATRDGLRGNSVGGSRFDMFHVHTRDGYTELDECP